MSRGPYWMPGARMGETGLVDPVMGALTDPFESILMGVAADGIGPVPAVRKVATGAAITAKILDEMERRDVELGLVTLCIGGGQGIAMLLGRG